MVAAEVWVAETLKRDDRPFNNRVLLHPVGLDFDGQGRPVAAWTESSGSGGAGAVFWARREDGQWRAVPVTRFNAGGVLSFYDPRGGAALTIASNGVPFLFHASANFANSVPFFLTRMNLETTPEGPGGFLTLLPGSASLGSTFDGDGRVSFPPDYVTWVDRGRLRWNGLSDLTADGVLRGNAAQVVFRQGPERQIHVLYQADDGRIHYNGGGPDRDQTILLGNTGSTTYSLAVDDANGLHAVAAEGTGRFFFGAVGRLTYLYSADGKSWTKQAFPQVAEDVGATAIALDSRQRPVVAFLRAFSSLMFTRFDGTSWTEPTLVRGGLGGWDFAKGIRLALDAEDRPHVVVADRLTRRLLHLSTAPEPVPTDLAVVSVEASTNRVEVGTSVALTMVITNAGPRNATAARLRIQIPSEWVVRDATPRPTTATNSVFAYDLGVLNALEARTYTWLVSALDPGRGRIDVAIESETDDPQRDNNRMVAAPVTFLSAPCLANPDSGGCDDAELFPKTVPPALSNEPWSMVFRAPMASLGSELRIAGSTPLPPGFCLTADGELRGVHSGTGRFPVSFDLVEPGGRATTFARDFSVMAETSVEGLAAFWSLDGHSFDSVAGLEGTLGARGAYGLGAVGSALQSARDAVDDSRPDWARPPPLFVSPSLFGGAAVGQGPVTVALWFRTDGGARSRGDARRFGSVVGWEDSQDPFRARHVAFDPATSRLNVLAGPLDFRAVALPGPVLPPNTWHHLAWVNDGVNTRLYTNGVVAVSGRFSSAIPERPVLVAGGESYGGAFSGAIDEIAVMRRNAEPREIGDWIQTPFARRRPLPAGGDFPIAAQMRELALPDAPEGERYEATLAHAFCGVPTAIRIVEGTIPVGLVLSEDGWIRGASKVSGLSRFRVRATDTAGAMAELAVQIRTMPGLPVFTRQPVDQQIDAGGLLLLTVETRSEAALQWYWNDRPLPGETREVLALDPFSNGQVGRYRVRASNAAGSTWSREVRVGLRTAPEKLPTVAVAPVVLRPNGVVQVQVSTLRGRVYELQRALDLSAALAGGWRTVQRFVAQDLVGRFEDKIPSRPGAAFYRVIEVLPPPALVYSFEDSGRYVGIADDGDIRPGLLPAMDATTGRLGAFEFRVSGESLPANEGLVLRFPQGAQPVERDGAAVLRFREGELYFGEGSPVQLSEGGTNRVVWTSATDVDVPSGPLSVETLERLLGKPRGSGIGLTFFRHFHFNLVSGVFDGDRIRNAQLAWADRAAMRIPAPERTGSYVDFDLELSATRLRLPFHGEFVLEDGTSTPGKIVVSPSRPIWLELRPGPEVAMSGRGKLVFPGGPEFEVDFTFDDPVFRVGVGAKRLRLPEGLTLRSFLGRVPLPMAPAAPPSSGFRQLATVGADYLKLVQGKAQELARKSCATSAAARRLLGESEPASGEIQDPGVEASDDEQVQANFTEHALAELRAWSCVAEAYGGVERVPEYRYVLQLIERLVSSAVTDSLPGASSNVELGAMTYAYRAAVLAEVAHMATLYPPEITNPTFAHQAVTDPRYASQLNPAHPQMQPYVDWAFEGFEALRNADPTRFDSTTLVVAAQAIAKVLAAANRNSTVIPQARAAAMQVAFEEVTRARAVALQRELNVEVGKYSPEDNPTIARMHRWEAMAYLRKALRIQEAAMLSGAANGRPVAPEVLAQLAAQAWRELRQRIEAVTGQCTAPAYALVLGAAAEIANIVRVGDQLELSDGVAMIPKSDTILAYNLAMERACAQAQPPVLLEDLYVRSNPARADEGRVLAFEGRLALMTQTPASIRTATPEIADALAHAKQAYDAVFVPTNLPPVAFFKPGLLLRTLRAGMMQDNLRRRFQMPADPDWLTAQLPALTRILKQRLKGENLTAANRLLWLAAWRAQANPVTLAGRGPSVALQTRLAFEGPDDAPDDLQRRHAYLLAAIEGVEAEETEALALGDAAGIDHAVSDVIGHLADVRLPGGLTVESVAGELQYHTGTRQLSGGFRGALQVPGAGLRLTLNRADFHTGGSFSGELFGSLSLPPSRPAATLSILPNQPARLDWKRGQAPKLSGGGRLALASGATFDCFLSLEDPVYRFSASARGLRFQLTRESLEQVGLPVAAGLSDLSKSQAIAYLLRAGLLVEGAQPPRTELPSFERLTPVEERPQPTGADAWAAGAAALWLLTHTAALDGTGAASAALATAERAGDNGSERLLTVRPESLPPATVEKGRVLFRQFTEQLSRANAMLADDALLLSQTTAAPVLAAEPVPDAEAETLRRAKVVEVAQRLESFGRHLGEITRELRTERGREITGNAAENSAWETELGAYLRVYRDALVAARDRLIIPVPSPAAGRSAWRTSEDWDRVAATNLLSAAQQYEVTVEGLGVTDAALLGAGPEVACSVFQVLLDERMESLGLDPVTGLAASAGGALAVHLGLDGERAMEGLRDLLLYEFWNQGTPFCAVAMRERLGRAIGAMVLRVREIGVEELQRGMARVEGSARRPWEAAEFVQGSVSRLLEIFDVPERLGLTRYPEPTFAVTPRSPNETIQDIRRDVADVFGLLDGAMRQLATLSQDESSGYPGELRRRRAVALPPAGPLARLLARYADVPAVAAVRVPLGRMAVFEAELLDVLSADPTFPSRLGRGAAGFISRVLNAARLLDLPAPAGIALNRVERGNVAPVRALTDNVLARVETGLRGQANLPWWVSATAARALHEASQETWATPSVRDAIQLRSTAAYDEARRRVLGLNATKVAPPAADLLLPGEVEVTRIFGGITLNRQTRYVLFELGGRLDFPNVRTADGRTAFLELQRLRLESTGQFALAAATRLPLPFAEASFAGSFRASGDFPRRALSLAGEGTLTFLSAPQNPETGQPFPNRILAAAVYEPVGYDAEGRPQGWRFAISAGGSFRQSFGKDFAVFGAGAGLIAGRSADGNPIAGVTVGGSVGLFRKNDRRQVEPPAPSDFHVLVENAGVEIVGTVNENGYAAVTNGTVRLPDFFYPADLPPELSCVAPGARRTGPTVAIQSPIRIRYAAGEKPRMEGTLRFSHFGLRLGGTNFLANTTATAASASASASAGYAALTVCQADVGIDSEGRPFLDIPKAGLGFNIPSWDRGLIRLQNVHLGFDGRTQGEIFLIEDFDLVRAGGLNIALLGAPAYADPAVRPPQGCRGTGLVLEDVPGFPQPRLTLSGGVRVLFPVDFLANTDGSQAGGFFCGGIRVEPTEDGPKISAFVDELGLTGNFKMGRSGFSLKGARIAAGNFGAILEPDSERPFYLSISGDLQTGPFVFGLNNAQVRYRGLDVPPAFGIEALRFARDATMEMPAPFSLLPATIDFAELRFKQASLPIAEMFAPQNLQITASFRVGLPTVQSAFLSGAASGVVFQFRENGTLIPPPIDGFDLALSSTANLKLPAFGDLSGKVRIGGFRRAIDADGTLHPDQIYAVGQLSATQQGYRMALLTAFNLLGPIGLCLDLNFGGAGLTLAPTPFQITGASGGIALLTAENPCDFSQFFEFDLTTGTYQLKQTVELPSIPTGMTWAQFTQTLEQMSARIEAFAGRFPSPPLVPSAAASAALAAPNADTSLTREANGDVADLRMAAAGSAGNAAGSAFPSGTFAAFGCPESCPPKTVAILCQPHPDTERFPNRVIFKYSSITEAMLTNPPPAGLGLDVAALSALGGDAARVGGVVADRLVGQLRNIAPTVPSLPPAIQNFLQEQERLALDGVRVAASNVVARAVAGSPDAYAAVRNELYRGMACPDLSLSLAGRMSVVGLSAFGWIEGRETTAFSGSGGVIGELYALGVSVGQARAFVSTTDANGLPNPSVCGQISASLGPLDFGQVDLALRCENCVVEFLRLFPQVFRAVGPAFARVAVERVAPEMVDAASNPEAFLALWRQETPAAQARVALGILSQLATAEPGLLPGNLGNQLREAFARSWDLIQPQLVLCGEITPRFLGLPLTLGGRTVGLNFLGEKSRVIGEFGFAPSNLVPLFPPGDEASFSFAYRLSDPMTMLLRSLDGTLTRPETVEAFVREQTESMLENMVLAASYQWHPFGLELGDAAIRVLMPDLLDHPAIPGSSWENPDDLSGAGVPSRDAVLVQAAANGKLGRAFDWLGTTNDFAEIFAVDDPRRAVAQQRKLDLRRSYFPHGGIVGGARMALPRILMVSPETWRPLYDQVVFGTDLFEQGTAALTLLQEFVLRTETNGTAAFYTPAPNPPLLYDAQGRQLSAAEIRARVVRQPDHFSPEGLVRQLRSLDFSAPQSLSHLYPDDLSFLRAEITNLTLFGMPVFGTARMTGRPTLLRALDGAPLARLEVDIAADSPVGKVAGGAFGFGFDLYATPEQNLAAWATEMVEAVEREMAGRGAVALQGEPRGTVSPQLVTEGAAPSALRGEARRSVPLQGGLVEGLWRQLPRFAATNSLPPLPIVNLKNWAAGSGPVALVAEEGLGGGGGGLFGRAARGGIGSVPPASPPVLRAEFSLYAFSPFYDPLAAGDGPVAEARRAGGLAASGNLEILPETPGRSGSAQAEVAVTVVGDQPRLAGRLRALNLPTPFSGVTLQNAQADFDSQATTFLRATTTVPNLSLGSLFRLQSAVAGQPLSATLTLSQSLPGSTTGTGFGGAAAFLQNYSSRAGLELAPARLSSDHLAGALQFHGVSGLTSPIQITESTWSARASFVNAVSGPVLQTTGGSLGGALTLKATLGGTRRDIVRLSGLPTAAFRVQGTAPDAFVAQLDAAVSGPITVELFPGVSVPGLPSPTLTVAAPANGGLQVEFRSDGTFRIEGVLASGYDAGAPGLFAADARVVVDAQGATISGNTGASTGNLQAGWFDGRLEARYSGQWVFPPISGLGGRVVLAGPDGGNMTATSDASGTCVSGAVLTLQRFSPADPVRIVFPRFCLTADRTFANVAPVSASEVSLQAPGDPDLGVGAFTLEDLRSLKLSGAFGSSTVSLDFEAVLKLGALLNVPVRGAVGTGGLQFVQNASSTTLLGFDFSDLRLGATNQQGDLPDIGFAGRLGALPAPLSMLALGGRVPGAGAFSLLPSAPIDLPNLVPAFPFQQSQPAFQYRPEAYAVVVRASQPSGYWPLDEVSGAVLDQRLAKFTGAQRRSGTVVGNVTRAEPGAFRSDENRGMRLDGGTAHVRISSEALAPLVDRFSVSLWFRRASAQVRLAPRTLAARGSQWSLALREPAPGDGTRLQFSFAGPTLSGGGGLGPLVGRTRVDDTLWHHAAAVYDGGALYLYLDGALEAWQAVEGTVLGMANVPTTLGARLNGETVTDAFNGWLDEVAVFPKVLRPVEVFGQWLAAGRGGISLGGLLPRNTIPGLSARGIEGFLGANGDAVVSLEPGGISEWGGVALPDFGATLFRQGGSSAAVFEAGLRIPRLEEGALGTLRGVMDGNGVIAARASALADRGLLGWSLRLTNLTLTGNWIQRTVSTRVGGRLSLPNDLAVLAIGGELDTLQGRYTLRGSAGGALALGASLPFSYSAQPELTEQRFQLPGRIALGTQPDAASFSTRLEFTRTGGLSATFQGLTDWISFAGIGHGRLGWSGSLGYAQGQPIVSFRGQLGLATPQHPESIEDLPEGIGVLVSRNPRITASFRDVDGPMTVNARGVATFQADPPFQGRAYFDFDLR